MNRSFVARLLSVVLVSSVAAALLAVPEARAAPTQHRFTGLPHYRAFAEYPDLAEEEFIGLQSPFVFSLVRYDFGAILGKQAALVDDNVRLLLFVFTQGEEVVYHGGATLEILDGDSVILRQRVDHADDDSLFRVRTSLADGGRFALRVTLHEADDLSCVIPFRLASQTIHWGKWIAAALLFVIVVFLSLLRFRRN